MRVVPRELVPIIDRKIKMRDLEISEIKYVAGANSTEYVYEDFSITDGALTHMDSINALLIGSCTRADAQSTITDWTPKRDGLQPVITLPGAPGVINRILGILDALWVVQDFNRIDISPV